MCSPKRPDWLLGPPSFLLNVYRGSVPGVQHPEHEVKHSLPSSVEVKNKWSYVSTPYVCPHGMDTDNSTFRASLHTGTHRTNNYWD
jgi:hypothetical protein